MQGKKRDEGREGGDNEGKGGKDKKSNDRDLPKMRHKDVQDYGRKEIVFRETIT